MKIELVDQLLKAMDVGRPGTDFGIESGR